MMSDQESMRIAGELGESSAGESSPSRDVSDAINAWSDRLSVEALKSYEVRGIRWCRENPIKSVAVAAAAGYLLARILK